MKQTTHAAHAVLVLSSATPATLAPAAVPAGRSEPPGPDGEHV
ncbi:hypothetical protein [Streptomyces sp. NPDC046939]